MAKQSENLRALLNRPGLLGHESLARFACQKFLTSAKTVEIAPGPEAVGSVSNLPSPYGHYHRTSWNIFKRFRSG